MEKLGMPAALMLLKWDLEPLVKRDCTIGEQ